MKKLRFVVSLWTQDNPYQRRHAAAAEEACRRLGIEVKILYANNDPMTQVEQLLGAIQAPSESRPDGIVCAPVGTTLPQVARQAVGAGIGWALLNREGEYVEELRKSHSAPVFSVSVDQEKIGAIQARQFGTLLPQGGLALYLLGPNNNPAAQRRLNAMQSAKPANIEVRTMTGNWSEQSGFKAIHSWLQLSSSHKSPVALVAGQNDDLAIGARKAFEGLQDRNERHRWLTLPFTGVDCCPGAGEDWIRKGLLKASVINPTGAGLAVEMLAEAIQSKSRPPEGTRLTPESFPSLEQLAALRTSRSSFA